MSKRPLRRYAGIGMRSSIRWIVGRTRLRAGSASCRPAGGGGADEPVEVVALGLVELECVRDPVQDALGDAAGLAALEAGVVLDADAGEQGDLLAAQPGDAAVGAVHGQPGLLGGDPGPARGEEFPDVVLGVHACNGTDFRTRGRPCWYPSQRGLPHQVATGLAGCMTAAATVPTRQQAPAHPRAILAIILVSYFLILLDNSVVFTGLPSIAGGARPVARGPVVGAGRVHAGVRRSAAPRRPAGRPARSAPGVRGRAGGLRRCVVPDRRRAVGGVADRGAGAAGRRRGHRRAVIARAADRQLPRGGGPVQGRRAVRRHRGHRRQPRPGRRRRRGVVDLVAGRVLHQPAHRRRDDRARAQVPAGDPAAHRRRSTSPARCWPRSAPAPSCSASSSPRRAGGATPSCGWPSWPRRRCWPAWS